MSVTIETTRSESLLTVHLRPAIELTDEQFFDLCQINRDLRLERTAEGDLIIMPPTGSRTSNAIRTSKGNSISGRSGTVLARLFFSSGGFKLPNGAERSPDASWISRSRLIDLTPEQQQRFLPLCPDFVIELRSPSGSRGDIKARMDEYIENGARLGWLIDPETRRVHIYRPGRVVEILEAPWQVSGDPVLSGFVLDLREIWEATI
jgi:Uma2 family endonuclease